MAMHGLCPLSSLLDSVVRGAGTLSQFCHVISWPWAMLGLQFPVSKMGTVVLEKTLESPWTARRPNQSILKEISPGCSLEGLMLKLKLQYFANTVGSNTLPPDAKSCLTGKDPDAGKDWGQEEKRRTEDEMFGWHHWLDGHGFGWTPGVGDGQGGLACCGSWGHKESDTTERLNWTDILQFIK